MGNIGGRNVAHGICAAAFTGAHLCYAGEYLMTESRAPIPASGAWLDLTTDLNGSGSVYGMSPLFGRYANNSCVNWTSTASTTGYTVSPEGGIAGASCNIAHPAACCF